MPDCVTRSERIKLRRALSYLGMTLILPGSTQLSGRQPPRRSRSRSGSGPVFGRTVLAAGVFALIWRGAAVSLFTNDAVLRVLQVLLIVVALGWGALLVDSFRLARPPELARRHRLGFATLNLGWC